MTARVLTPARRAILNRRSLRLAYATTGYNLCTYLSAVLLVGLVLNAALGWTWADSIAALVIAGVAMREGVEAWRGEQCEDCAAAVGNRDH